MTYNGLAYTLLKNNGLDIKSYYKDPQKFIESITDDTLKKKILLYADIDNYICWDGSIDDKEDLDPVELSRIDRILKRLDKNEI